MIFSNKKFVMRSFIFILSFLAPLFMYCQDTYIRFENGYGKSKFVGGDESGMVDNKTFNLGLIIEQEVEGNTSLTKIMEGIIMACDIVIWKQVLTIQFI